MGISKFNHEGYYDPTPHEALTNIMRKDKAEKKPTFKPLVYICSPYSGDVEGNVKKARSFCRFALESKCIPIAPHLMFSQFMDDGNPEERKLALFMDIVLLGKCAEVWVLGHTISNGMAREIEVAQKRRQTVRYFSPEHEEVEGL
jgi:hypothetical protein